MIDFARSFFTWHGHPWKRDPHYKYAGGFVGELGDQYHVRLKLDAALQLRNESTGRAYDLYLWAPCRTEYTIAQRNLFQIPSGEFRVVFGRDFEAPIARRPSGDSEDVKRRSLAGRWQDYRIDVRSYPQFAEVTDGATVVEATLANDLLNVRHTYREPQRGVTVTYEYPAELINLNARGHQFQVCTGPVIVPDLATWDGTGVDRVFLAEVACASFDWVEFILRREIEASDADKSWLNQVRGRDRRELWDPNNQPPGYAPANVRPTVYNETLEFAVTTTFMRAPNP